MIERQSHLTEEVRVIRIVLSRPWLISEVESLENDDFDDLACKLVWSAIRSVTEVTNSMGIRRPTRGSAPSSHTEMLLECAEWLRAQPGCLPDNYYGMVAAELVGESHLWSEHRPVLPKSTIAYVDGQDDVIRPALGRLARVLRFAARARTAEREAMYATIRRPT